MSSPIAKSLVLPQKKKKKKNCTIFATTSWPTVIDRKKSSESI